MFRSKIKIALVSVGALLAIAATLAYIFMPRVEPTVTLGGKSYSVSKSDFGSLLDYDEAREVLERHMPGITDIRQQSVARPLTLVDMQPFYAAIITEQTLLAVDAELRQLKGSSVVMYTTGSTQVGIILDDPEARAIVDKYLPGFSTNPDIDQGRGFTLNFMQKFNREVINDQVLANINADFEALAKSRAGIQ
ncbi:hypothetical protein [Halioxenophilus sp. WMMB6]|uniref:hypothetical protein n=1 Tax=Halioxenophilus sp. WMMB6 TaxID=3073815 RepID=UPI00295EE414|nr:hypothetical protein [Halioxenophilus sp. WMMB6]